MGEAAAGRFPAFAGRSLRWADIGEGTECIGVEVI